MSNSDAGHDSYTPAPARLSPQEFFDIGNFFKQLIDSSSLRWAIIAAGTAAILDIAHILWPAARYVFKF